MELRAQAESRIEDSPSLAHHADTLYRKAWPQARRIPERSLAAYGERVALPDRCPCSLAQVLDSDFVPKPRSAAVG